MPNKLIIFGFIGFVVIFVGLQNADADVWIPENEFTAYFDSNGIYTVVGTIKNSENFAVIPTVTINIQDGKQKISKSFEYVAISPSKELPFRMKFPEVTSSSPILESSDISYVRTEKTPLNIEVIYDDTLVQYDDGHLTGRIINSGNSTVFNIKIFAIIHGYERILDMGQNIEMIEKMEPGEIRAFSMYPDPAITEDVYYYSCFAPSDNSIVPMYTERNGEKFYFRYDAGSWYYDPQFNEEGTELSMKTQTSFNLKTYANFEFLQVTADEKFQVYLNDEPKQFTQSIDEYGNWHVAFIVEPFETGEILITGFEEGWNSGEQVIIPDWIKNNAKSWSESELDYNIFARGIKFMMQQDIIKISVPNSIGNEEIFIPEWIKTSVGWWIEGQISDDEFINSIGWMVEKGKIRV